MRQGIEILINYLFYERNTEIYSWKVVNFDNFCVFSVFIDPPKMPHEYISSGVNHRSLSFDSCR